MAALAIADTQAIYDEQRIFERASVIQVAIDARHQAFPDEPVFTYQPFVGKEDAFRFTPETFERVIRDYNTSRPIAAAASLAELEASTGDRYFHDAGAGVMHLKLVTQAGRDWATMPVEPR